MNAKVRDVMTTRVDMIGHGAAFDEIAARLSELRVSALPVIDDQYTVTGIVYDTDLLEAEAVELAREALRANGGGPAAAHPRRRYRSLTAGDLGAHPSITIAPDEPAEHALLLMHNCRVKLLLVRDPAGRLVGTVSPANLLAAGDRLRSS
jgi:CBS-domain-containing membrane protein